VRNRLTYANVAATLALVFSMSGGAMAASHYLINSTRQINPKVLKKLKGKTGKPGPTGKTGAQGLPGAQGVQGVQGVEGKAGPSEAISSHVSSAEYPNAANAAEVVTEITVSAGSYTLSATVTPESESTSASEAGCVLLQGEEFLGEAKVNLAGEASASLALSGVYEAKSTVELWLACKSTTTQGKYLDPTLTATKVGSLG
jgi:hypothetical protein